MASVLYGLRMICWLFLFDVRQVGVVKNPEPGVILARQRSCWFSPARDKIWIRRLKQAILKAVSSI